MAFAVEDREVRPLTADEAMRMVELGILGEDEPVELLHGVLTRKPVKSPEHETVKMRLNRALVLRAAAAGCDVRVEASLVVPDRTSLPEPDLVVVESGGDPYRHPTTALLVVEVAVSSLKIDTGIKPALYAAAGVPELWVLDVPRRRLERFSDPRPDGYGRQDTLAPPARVELPGLAVEPIDLGELFAGL